MPNTLLEIVLASISVASYFLRFIIVSSYVERRQLIRIKSALDLSTMVGFMTIISINSFEKKLVYTAVFLDYILLYLNLFLNFKYFTILKTFLKKPTNYFTNLKSFLQIVEIIFILMLVILIGLYLFTSDKTLSIYRVFAVCTAFLSLLIGVVELDKLKCRENEIVFSVLATILVTIAMSFMKPLC